MAGPKWKGLNDGVTGEWTIIAKVKPGQEEALRKYAKDKLAEIDRGGKVTDLIIPVGTVHDYRFVFLDNGTRIMFCSNFDGDWGQYIDDFFATKIVEEGFDGLFAYCEGYPGRSASHKDKKDWFQAHTQGAVRYIRAYRATVKEIWKALEVQKAFQQVLDDPAAAKPLEHPAMKPLAGLAVK